MTSLEKEQYFGFIRRKIEMLRERMPAVSRAGFGNVDEKMLVEMDKQPVEKLRVADFKDMDSDIEVRGVACMGRKSVEEVVKLLSRERGMGRIGEDTKSVARRVLKRGRTKTDEERYCVKELLSNDQLAEFLSVEELARLEGIAGKEGL